MALTQHAPRPNDEAQECRQALVRPEVLWGPVYQGGHSIMLAHKTLTIIPGGS